MKKIRGITIIIVIFITVTLFYGCSDDTKGVVGNSNNAFEDYESQGNEPKTSQIGVECKVVNGPESMQFEYDGKPIEFEYEFESNGDCEMGLMIFMDGIVQPFIVDSKTTTIYKEKLTANKLKTFQISFIPITGEKGENVQVIFANIFNPNIIRLKNSVNTFGNNHNIFQPMPWSIKMKQSVQKKEIPIGEQFKEVNFSESELKSFIRTEADGSRTNKLDITMYFNCEETSCENGVILQPQKEKSLKFFLYGNFPGKYRITLIGDFKPVTINGYDYIDVDVKGDKKYTLEVNPNKNDFSKYENVFAVAIPLDNDIGLLKSKSLYVED